MAVSERIIKKILIWVLGICFVGPAVAISAVVLIDYLKVQQSCSRFEALSSEKQLHWLRWAGSNRDRRFTNAIRRTLQDSDDRVLLEAAGYAAMRIGASELLPLMRKRADEGPDDIQRAQLINYAGQVSNRDARLYDWLMAGVESAEPWRRVGSAIGLLHIGRTESGPLLSGIVREGPDETRALAMHNLAWIARPLGQAIGKPMPFLDVKPPPADSATLDQIDNFWTSHVTLSLLNDVLSRLTNRDPDWAEMNRLIHARDKIAKWLQ